MILAFRSQYLVSMFKPIAISGHFTEKQNLIKSQTSPQAYQWQVHNAMQTVLSGLIGCEAATLRLLANRKKIAIGKVSFIQVRSQYNLQNFKKGGSTNKFEDIKIKANIEIDSDQEQLNKLKLEVQQKCPVYQVITGSGVKVTSQWKQLPYIAQ